MNELIYLLRREIDEPIRPLLFFVTVSGLSSALLIGIINSAAEHVANAEVNHTYFFLFVLAVGVAVLSKKFVLDKSSKIVETVIFQLRQQLADKIRHTELNTLEKIGLSPLYARLTYDTVYISNFSTSMINTTQSAIMVSFTVLYIAAVSLWSFVMVTLGIAAAIFYYRLQSSSFYEAWAIVSVKETIFFEKLGHILRGFKEIKINRRKNEGVFDNYGIVNKELQEQRLKTSYRYNVMMTFTQVFFSFYLALFCFSFLNFMQNMPKILSK